MLLLFFANLIATDEFIESGTQLPVHDALWRMGVRIAIVVLLATCWLMAICTSTSEEVRWCRYGITWLSVVVESQGQFSSPKPETAMMTQEHLSSL